jgi:hypothetical protein
MGKVDEAEKAQLMQGMVSLAEECNQIAGRIIEGWEEGVESYKSVLGEEELPGLLERLRKLPTPKESECKQMKKGFETGVGELIKAHKITAKCIN